MSKESRLVKTTAILLIGIIGTKLVNFLLLPLLTSWLSVEDYGNVDIFLTIISLVVPFSSLQLEQAVFRFLIDDKTLKDRKETISSSFLCVLIILFIADLIIVPILLLNGFILYFWYLVAINLQTLYIMLQQVVRGEGHNDTYTLNSVIFAVSTLFFCAVFIYLLELSITGYIFSYCAAIIISIINLAFKTKIYQYLNFVFFNKFKLINMLKYSIPMILNNVSWWILNASDKMVISLFLGSSSNGIFAAAGKIPGLITSVYTVFQMAWQESTSREKDSLEAMERFYSNVFRSLFVILSYAVISIMLLSCFIFPILIDNKFYNSFNHIPILLIGLFFLCLAQFYGGIYVGMHKSKELGWTSSIAAVVNLIVDLGLINIIGIYAASISTLVAYFVLYIIRAYSISKSITISYKTKDVILIITVFCLTLWIFYNCDSTIHIGSFVIVSAFYFLYFKDIFGKYYKLIVNKFKN